MHGGISQEILEDVVKANIKPKPIPNKWIERFDPVDLPSPEDCSKKRSLRIEVVTIPPVQCVSTPKIQGERKPCNKTSRMSFLLPFNT